MELNLLLDRGKIRPQGAVKRLRLLRKKPFSFSHRAAFKHRVELYKSLYQKPEVRAGQATLCSHPRLPVLPRKLDLWAPAPWRVQIKPTCIGSACSHFLHCLLSFFGLFVRFGLNLSSTLNAALNNLQVFNVLWKFAEGWVCGQRVMHGK